MAFFFFFSGQVALCQLTHLIPALIVINDMGAADLIYLSIGKIKEEEINFFLKIGTQRWRKGQGRGW